MSIEIERKFLVNHTKWEKSDHLSGLHCVQTYLVNEASKNVRVRIMGDQGFLTIKGKTVGISRTEFEYEIPKSDAEQLIQQFGEKVIDKTRYQWKSGTHNWEVDVFHGENQGLILAEIELKSEEEPFEKPDWLEQEVSHDVRYYNSNLLNHPFSEWKNL